MDKKQVCELLKAPKTRFKSVITPITEMKLECDPANNQNNHLFLEPTGVQNSYQEEDSLDESFDFLEEDSPSDKPKGILLKILQRYNSEEKEKNKTEINTTTIFE